MNNKDAGNNAIILEEPNRMTATANLPSGGRILLSEMENGRDEMNLVEFPLAALASRLPKGTDTLVFEDWIWDKRQRANVRKRLTVAASVEFGLPTASDDEVILGLVQLAKAEQFADRSVSFLPVQLFRLLGWREEGRSYSRLEISLKRWLGVTLYYDHAWWDNQRKVWCDEHFHLLENVTIRRRPKRVNVSPPPGKQDWSITWNEVMFRSCQSGYLKRLDMGVYRRLTLAAAKRMYRFLDKRFYFTNRLTFDLRTFACEHIGCRRGDDTGQLKRRLNRAIEQLEGVGFLESMSLEARYRKLRRGHWEIVFLRKRVSKTKNQKATTSSPREVGLVKRGIRPPVAARLVREHTDMAVSDAIQKFDRLMQRGQGGSLENPPGLLVAWIREWDDSNQNGTTVASPEEKQARKRRLEAQRQRKTEETAQIESERDAVRAHLKTLSPQQFASLEAEALENATPFLVKCYRRNHVTGNTKLFHQYRDMIIESHVRDLLELRARNNTEAIKT